RGNLGLDLATAIDYTVVDTKPVAVDSTTQGPVSINGKVVGGLLVGRSSSALKGLTIIPGVIDADYTGVIKIMLQTQFPPIHIPAGSLIAQFVLYPQTTGDIMPRLSTEKGAGGFDTTGPAALLTLSMGVRPEATVAISNGTDGLQLTMLLDTGADIMILS
ncbi:POK9 protein, partial [Semnornis frantzii]|nr:POK9 protein [Semnornis frantzii]